MHNEQLHSDTPSSGVANVMPAALQSGRFMAYLRLGWCPIPLKARDKAPVGSWKSYQTEFPKSPQCASWEAGDNNVGIVTGSLSEIFVVDVDGEKGKATLRALEKKYGALPETPTVHTGKGRHFYLRHPEGIEIRNLSGHSSSGEIMPGIDVRADGGYVVAPPSIHPNGKQYVWHISPWDIEIADAPQWVLDLVVVKPHAAPMLDYNNADDNHHDAYLQAALQGELAALVQAASGTRNDQLNRSAFALGQLIAGGLNEQEARSKLEVVALA